MYSNGIPLLPLDVENVQIRPMCVCMYVCIHNQRCVDHYSHPLPSRSRCPCLIQYLDSALVDQMRPAMDLCKTHLSSAFSTVSRVLSSVDLEKTGLDYLGMQEGRLAYRDMRCVFQHLRCG